eukprot:2429537-Pyramimonas_sp.AAC.1
MSAEWCWATEAGLVRRYVHCWVVGSTHLTLEVWKYREKVTADDCTHTHTVLRVNCEERNASSLNTPQICDVKQFIILQYLWICPDVVLALVPLLGPVLLTPTLLVYNTQIDNTFARPI